MRRYATGLAMLALVTSCSQHAAGAGPSQIAPSRLIVALGDSLTSGHGLEPHEAYPARLEQMIRAAGLPFTVVNHGVSGDTTAGALRRVPNALAAGPDILIVAVGANDGLRGVPIREIRANIEAIVQAAQARGIEVLLCGMETLPLHGWNYMVEFHHLFPELAEQYGIPLVPFMLEGVVARRDMLLPDYVHPNAAGALQIARTIWAYLHPLAARIAGGERAI